MRQWMDVLQLPVHNHTVWNVDTFQILRIVLRVTEQI